MTTKDHENNLIINNTLASCEKYFQKNKSRFKGDFAASTEHLKIMVLNSKRFELQDSMKNLERVKKNLNSGISKITQLNTELKKDITFLKSNVGPVIDGAYKNTCSKTTHLSREALSLYNSTLIEHDKSVRELDQIKKKSQKICKQYMVPQPEVNEVWNQPGPSRQNEDEDVNLRGNILQISTV